MTPSSNWPRFFRSALPSLFLGMTSCRQRPLLQHAPEPLALTILAYICARPWSAAMPIWTRPPPHDTAPLVDWAQWYAAQGWPVFPCRGKHPAIPSAHPPGDPLYGQCRGECGQQGHGHYDATLDPFDIAIWWRQWPTANIGCPSGPHWWGLDVDPKNNGDDTLFRLQANNHLLPHTLMSHTGGGGNDYFWLPPVLPVQNKAPLGEGLDVQAGGLSYLILPPSIHPDTGKPYLWDIVDGPEDITPQLAPDWLEVLVTQPQASTVPAKATAAPGAPIPMGMRDNTLIQLAGAMRRVGSTVDEIRAALDVANTRCVTPRLRPGLCQIGPGPAAPGPFACVGRAPTFPCDHPSWATGADRSGRHARTHLPQAPMAD